MPNLTVSADIDSFMQSATKADAAASIGALTTTQIAGLSTTAPAALATTAVVGLSAFAARADHQHVYPTLGQLGAQAALTTSAPLALSLGGTGAITRQEAMDALAGATTSGQYLRGNGTDVVMSAIQAGDVPTLNQNTTGTAENVTGTVAIANGGTGQTTNELARSAFGSLQNVTVRHSSSVTLATAGTISGGTWTSGSAVITFTSSTVALVPGMSLSAGVTAGVIKTVDSATQITMTLTATASGSGSITVYNSTASSLITSSIFSVDSKTLAVNDIVCLMAQAATAQNGPWVVSAIGTGFTLTRPSWFSGVLLGSQLLYVQYGTANYSTIVSVSPNILPTTSATIGLDGLSAVSVIWRSTTAVIAGNVYTGTQTFVAGSTTTIPAKFQSGSLASTPTAHSIEWDGVSMYLTTSTGTRTTNLVNTSIPATSTSTGVVGQMAVDNTNNFLYVCTATNVWKRVSLTTF